MTASEIRLSKTAPWADEATVRSTPALRGGRVAQNGGASAYFAEVGGRYFRISRAHRDGLWDVDEIEADGEYRLRRDRSPDGILRNEDGSYKEHDFAFLATVLRLADAREAIATEVSR